MKSKIRRNTLWILILMLFLSLSMMISNKSFEVNAEANAESTEQTFYMKEGASLKIKTETGSGCIRFLAYLDKDFYDTEVKNYENVAFYTLVNINSDLSVDEIVKENESATLKSVAWPKSNFDDADFVDGVYSQYITLIFGENYYENQITVRPYIYIPQQGELAEDKYIYCDLNDSTRSMMDVANAAIMDDANYISTLSKYLGNRTIVENTAKNYIETLSTTESTNTFAFSNDESLNLENPSVKLGAKDITAKATVLGNKVTVSDDILSDLELGKAYKLSVVTNDTIYRSEFTYVSKAIKTKADMQVFSMDTLSKIEGYYVLASDVDMEGESVSHSSMTSSTSSKTYGFHGIFDGNGYTLKTAVGKYGIFGALNTAVIKNVNIVVNGVSGTDGANALAYNANMQNDGLNSMITLSDVNLDVQTETACTVYGRLGGYVSHSNVMIRLADSAQSENGVLVGSAPNWVKAERVIGENTYVINSNKEYPLMVTADSTAYWADGENENVLAGIKRYANLNELKTSGNNFSSFGSELWDVSTLGVPVWDDTIDLLTNFYMDGKQVAKIEINLGLSTKIAYSAASIDIGAVVEIVSGDEYIALNDGILTAIQSGKAIIKASGTLDKQKYEEFLTVTVCKPLIKIEERVELFSVADGLANGQDIKTFIGNEEIVAVSQEGNENITYADGKLLNVVPSIIVQTNQLETTVSAVTVKIETESKIYELQLMAYTKVILTTEDMQAINNTNDGVENDVITGYYILGTDVNAEKFSYNRDSNVGTTSFRGVFDGNGHTITYKASAQGLFLYMRQAAVKNVTINVTGVRSTTAECYVLAKSTGGDTNANSRVDISNVTIDYSNVGTNAGCYVVKTLGTHTHFTNVTVNAGSANANNGKEFVSATSNYLKTTNVTFTDTKVITSFAGALMSNQDKVSGSVNNGKYVAYYASNDTNVPTSGDGATAATPIIEQYAGLTREAPME